MVSCSPVDPSRRRQQEAKYGLGKWPLSRLGISLLPKGCRQDTFSVLRECEETILSPGSCLARDWIAWVWRKIPSKIRTSTSGCVGVVRIILSRTAGEEAREKGGERALEHG